MRWYVYIILFALVLVAPFAVRAFVGGHAVEKASDGPELVIVTPHNQDIRKTFEQAFAQWHRERFGTGVRITYLVPGGTNDMVRLLQDTYGAQQIKPGQLPPPQDIRVSIDLAWGGGDVVFDRDLKPLLQPVALPPSVLKDTFPTPDLSGVALYEKTRDNIPPKWVGVALSTFGIIYSPTFYDKLGLPPPQTWDDLTRPELAGLVALADPTRSGSAATTYMVPIQRAMADAEAEFLAKHPQLNTASPEYQSAIAAGWKKGMRTLLLMAANSRYFTDQAPQPCNDVGGGEAAAGLAIDFFARVYEQEVGSQRLRYVAPRGATAINPDPIAVLYGVTGQREVLANRFIEFLLTPEAQRMWNLKSGVNPNVPRSLRRLPVRRDVYSDRANWADDVNPFEQSGGFNLRQEWMRLFTDIRPIWAAAWIDCQSSLKESYETILKVSDPTRRAALLHELSDLPIEMSDVAAQQAKRTSLQGSGEDSRLWMTRQRIDWANKFRAHYAAVAGKAKT